jgi:DNA-binding GntR family transcriptional regulator
MGKPQIATLDQTNLRDSAYFALRDAFTRGEFAPGDTVSLRDLAAQLGTSMTPVREAVRRLVAEGALVDKPNRTLAVPPFDLGRMRELKSARLALELLLLDDAMTRMTPEAIARLEAILEAPRASTGGMPDLSQNYDFHFTLYQTSGSEVLLPVVKGLWLQYGAYLNLIIRQDAAPNVDEHVHHLELIAALKAGDAAAARMALTRDIERSFNILGSEA